MDHSPHVSKQPCCELSTVARLLLGCSCLTFRSGQCILEVLLLPQKLLKAPQVPRLQTKNVSESWHHLLIVSETLPLVAFCHGVLPTLQFLERGNKNYNTYASCTSL